MSEGDVSGSSAPGRSVQDGRGGRPPVRDERAPSGTGGAPRGTGGLLEGGLERLRGAGTRDLMIGAMAISIGAVAVTVVNSLTVQVDNPDVAAWKPWVWEGTSALVVQGTQAGGHRATSHCIDMANEAGGPDNISVVAARFEDNRLLWERV